MPVRVVLDPPIEGATTDGQTAACGFPIAPVAQEFLSNPIVSLVAKMLGVLQAVEPSYPVAKVNVLDPDRMASCQKGGLHQCIAQFPNIPRPAVILEDFSGLPRTHSRMAELLKEVWNEMSQVFGAFAKGRKRELEDAESVIEICAERPLGNGFLQIGMCCAENTDLDSPFLAAANPPKSAGLEDAQQARLVVGGELTDFIEKKRSPVSLLQ